MAQSPSANRDVAEQLARSGQTFEALAAFDRIVAETPATSRSGCGLRGCNSAWDGRRKPRRDSARCFASIRDVDASVSLGSALTRRDAWSEALAVLFEAAPRGGENSDPFGRSSVRPASAGTTVVPSGYYRRAIALCSGRIRTWSRGTKPRCARNGSSIVVEGFGEAGVSDARAIPVTASIRVLPRLEVEGLSRRHPSPVVLRRRHHRRIPAAGVGYRRALAARHALHVIRGRRSTPPASPPATTPCWRAKRFAAGAA